MSLLERRVADGWGPEEPSPEAESVEELEVAVIVATLEIPEIQKLIQI